MGEERAHFNKLSSAGQPSEAKDLVDCYLETELQ